MTNKKAPARSKPHGSATVASILGVPATKARKNGETSAVKGEWAKFHERLMELREQLMRQMNGLAKESAQEMAGYSLISTATSRLACFPRTRMRFTRLRRHLNGLRRTLTGFAS